MQLSGLLLLTFQVAHVSSIPLLPNHGSNSLLDARSRHHRHHHHHHHKSGASAVSAAAVSASHVVNAAIVTASATTPATEAIDDEDEDCESMSDDPEPDSTRTDTTDDPEDDEDCESMSDDPVVSGSSSVSAPVLSVSSSSSLSSSASADVASSTVSASTVASSTPVADSSVSKRGLGWPWNGQKADFALFQNTKVSWLYNWETWSPNPPSGIEYVPTQRTTSNDAGLANAVKNVASKTVLGWNEPDNAGQANISPASAAPLWKQYFNPLASSGFKVVSPAITNSGAAGQGVDWLKQFNTACNNACSYDVVATHWYGGGIDDFKSHVDSVYAAFNKPVWVTEFALSDASNADKNLAFLTAALDYLDSTSYVERYAYFGAFRGDNSAMITNSGALNALGQLYIK